MLETTNCYWYSYVRYWIPTLSIQVFWIILRPTLVVSFNIFGYTGYPYQHFWLPSNKTKTIKHCLDFKKWLLLFKLTIFSDLNFRNKFSRDHSALGVRWFKAQISTRINLDVCGLKPNCSSDDWVEQFNTESFVRSENKNKNCFRVSLHNTVIVFVWSQFDGANI